VRTRVTLDDDLTARLEREARRTERSLAETVNDLIRFALWVRPRPGHRRPFRVEPRHHELRPGLPYDRVRDLLEAVEGPLRR
jgi:hypothetical protein